LQIMRITAPPVVAQSSFITQQLCPHRIQMNVIVRNLRLPVAAAIHNQALVTAAKQMPDQLVPPVEPRRVNAQKPLHSRRQIRLRRLDYKLKTVEHQPAPFRSTLARKNSARDVGREVDPPADSISAAR
jgi:hypothetical protein